MDSESAAKPSRGSAWFIWLFVLVLIGYPLSAGPALAFFQTKEAPGWVEWLYGPLGYAYDNVKSIRTFYDWYLPLWGVR